MCGRLGSLSKRLATAGTNIESDDKIRTLLEGFPVIYATTRDLIREPGKKHHQAR